MSKYSNVNANSLYNAANTALSELNNHNMSSTAFKLEDMKNLNTIAGSTITSNLYQITNSKKIMGSITILKKYLENLKKVADYVKKCQELDDEISYLEREIARSEHTYYLEIRLRNKRNSLSSYESKIDNLLS